MPAGRSFVHPSGETFGGSTLTVGELRAALADVPDDMPLTVLTPEGSWWLNVDHVHIPPTMPDGQPEEPSVMLATRDDFDTRQF